MACPVLPPAASARGHPQTLSGFFCYSRDYAVDDRVYALRFLNLSGRCWPLVDPFLRLLRDYGNVLLVHCCNCLLICRCWKLSPFFHAEYVVCNPATGKWTVLPAAQELHPQNIIRLGFDPAAPSRFPVFVLVWDQSNDRITGVDIYSSETRGWTSMQSDWGHKTSVHYQDSGYLFYNGTMHFTSHDSSIVTVDTEGKTWTKFRMPYDPALNIDYGFIGQSHGHLYAIHIDHYGNCQLSVWVPEDYASGQWTLKHTVNVLELFGRHLRKHGEFYTLLAIHPECNLIFLADVVEETLVSYDMDSRKVHAICISE